MKKRGKKINAIWRGIFLSGKKRETGTVEATEEHVAQGLALSEGEVLEYVKYVPRPTDPSLLDQLRERQNLNPEERLKAYLNACALAPHASASTKRKWRKALEGGTLIV